MTAKILVVDDVLSNVKLLEARLKAEYYTVIVAHDGEEAIDLVAKQQPDIILLDIMMPKMNGFEVCKELKSDPLTTHIPIIMVTALHDTHDRVQGINAGADDFLTKPINETALSSRIKSLTRLKMIIDELRLRGETNAEIGGVAGNSIMDYSNQIFDANVLVIDEDVHQAEQIYNILKQRFRSIKILSDPMEALNTTRTFVVVLSGFITAWCSMPTFVPSHLPHVTQVNICLDNRIIFNLILWVFLQTGFVSKKLGQCN